MKVSELPRTYRYSYQMDVWAGGITHRYLVMGRHGALDFHVRESDMTEEAGYGRYSAGLECHWRTPPHYMADEPPSHDCCWAIKAPCWHDGTSLYAEEHLLPFWQGTNHMAMFSRLAMEADSRFNEDREADQ